MIKADTFTKVKSEGKKQHQIASQLKICWLMKSNKVDVKYISLLSHLLPYVEV